MSKGGGRWVRRGLNSFAKLIAAVCSRDDPGDRGLLQQIDARAKVVGLLGLVVVATLVHSFAALFVLYVLCVLLAVSSRVRLRRFAAIWLVVPLFSAAIMLPATLNLVTDGHPVWVLWSGVAVTDTGLALAGRFVLRTAVCVSLTMLLAWTTRPVRLFRGLRMLGVPQVFVALLTMMERYLAVLAKTAQEIHTAKISRTIAVTNLRGEHAWVAAGMGALYRRTHSLGRQVHLAMISRGYSGEVRMLDEPRMRPRDLAFLLGAAALGVGLVWIG